MKGFRMIEIARMRRSVDNHPATTCYLRQENITVCKRGNLVFTSPYQLCRHLDFRQSIPVLLNAHGTDKNQSPELFGMLDGKFKRYSSAHGWAKDNRFTRCFLADKSFQHPVGCDRQTGDIPKPGISTARARIPCPARYSNVPSSCQVAA